MSTSPVPGQGNPNLRPEGSEQLMKKQKDLRRLLLVKQLNKINCYRNDER
jgi:hypothetical protein